jgi:hypothetical protein
MPDYLADGDVKALLTLVRSLPELPVLDTLAAGARLARAVEPLALEVLSLRQRVNADAVNFERYGRAMAAKDHELAVVYAKCEALEKRLAARVA